MPSSIQDADFLHAEFLTRRQIEVLIKIQQHMCELGYSGL